MRLSTGLANGYKVVGLDRTDSPIKNKNFRFVKGNMRDGEVVEGAIKGCDYVIHLAAMASLAEFKEDLKNNYRINVDGFINVIDAATRNKCKRFLYASSGAVYLDVFSEDSIIDIKKQKNHYSKSKLMDEEMMADSYSDVHKLSTIGVRFFNVYGIGEYNKQHYASPVMQFIAAEKRKETIVIFGDGKQSKDFIYLTDAVKILFLLLEKAENGVYNIGTGVATDFNHIVDLINSKNKKYIPNPLATYQYFTKADTKKLTKAIGNYKFVSMEEGIRMMKEYYL